MDNPKAQHPERPRLPAVAHAEELLATRGHDLGFARIRIAAGRSGVVVGFPRDPMVHVSWWALGGFAVAGIWLRRRGP